MYKIETETIENLTQKTRKKKQLQQKFSHNKETKISNNFNIIKIKQMY